MPDKRMESLTVGERMTTELVSLQDTSKLEDAIRMLQQFRIRHIPVLQGAKLVGVLSDRDVKKATPSVVKGFDRKTFYSIVSETPVSRVMAANPVTIAPTDTIAHAVRTMVEKQVGCLPVVIDGNLLGIITQGDMMVLFLEELESGGG